MKITIKLLRPFSDIIGKNKLEIEFDGSTVKNMLGVLIQSYPKMKKEIYIKNEELTEYLCIFVNDKSLSALNGLNTRLKNNDEIIFFFPISGG